jgi:hypothetical protein
VAEAEFDGDEHAREASKAIRDIGATDGPGRFTEPEDGMPEPDHFDRRYLSEGHAAASPQQGPPNVSPLPPEGRGILTPLPQSPVPAVAGHAGPITDTIKMHAARAAAEMPRMPIPRGSA